MTAGTRPSPAPAADPWRDVSAARLAAAGLAALAPLRDQDAVRVDIVGDVAWVRWPAGRVDVVRCLLPVPKVELFVLRDGLWYRFGSRLPTADGPPSGYGRSVAALIVPSPFEAVPPVGPSAGPVGLRVVRGGGPNPVTAMTCLVADLGAWADIATTAELAAVTAARSGGRAVLLGKKLPSIAPATRFWGDDLLVPIGFRPDPDLPPAALRAAVGAAADEQVVLHEHGADVIPRSAFEPLTRAGVRLAVRGAHPEGGPV